MAQIQATDESDEQRKRTPKNGYALDWVCSSRKLTRPGLCKKRLKKPLLRCPPLATCHLAFGSASLRIACNLFQHRLPRHLLRLYKCQEFGRRHRIGVVASRLKLGPGRRIKDCLAQAVAKLAHNRVGRPDRSDQREPAAGIEAWKRLRHQVPVLHLVRPAAGAEPNKLEPVPACRISVWQESVRPRAPTLCAE
jgi:hypothetical protein